MFFSYLFIERFVRISKEKSHYRRKDCSDYEERQVLQIKMVLIMSKIKEISG